MIASEPAMDSRARRAARRVGLLARKSRWVKGTVDNRGGFILLEPIRNIVRGGQRFDLSAEDIIEACK